jgi:hypothetical protein
VIDPKLISTVVPVFVAIMVWVIRILIIGTLSLAMDRMLHPAAHRGRNLGSRPFSQPAQQALPVRQLNTNPGINTSRTLPRAAAPASTGQGRQVSEYGSRASTVPAESGRSFAEPTYHSLNAAPPQSTTRSASFEGANSNPRR